MIRRRTTSLSGALLPGVALLAGVVTVSAAEVRRDAVTFAEEHAAWVQQREAELTRPDGWTSLIGLHWLDGEQQTVGASEENDIRLRIGPDRLGEMRRRAGTLYFEPAADADVALDGAPVRAEVALVPEGRGGGTKLVYDDGRGQISVIGRGDRLALRVRHADSPERLGFRGLDVYPPDPDWRVSAVFVPHPAGKTLRIVNIVGDESDTPNPGFVEFEKDGRAWRLEATGDPAKGLHFVFRDATSGKETYAVARFLRTGPVAPDGTVVVDFNRAYNPPCAFTEYATCPLPPRENHFVAKTDAGETVRLAVRAGEKTYAAAP